MPHFDHSTFDLATLAQLSAALIFLVPYITGLLTRAHLPRWANELIAFGVSFVAGLVAYLQAGGSFRSIHDLSSLAAAVGVIFAGAKIYYKKLADVSPLIARSPLAAGFSAWLPASSLLASGLLGNSLPYFEMPPQQEDSSAAVSQNASVTASQATLTEVPDSDVQGVEGD